MKDPANTRSWGYHISGFQGPQLINLKTLISDAPTLASVWVEKIKARITVRRKIRMSNMEQMFH